MPLSVAICGMVILLGPSALTCRYHLQGRSSLGALKLHALSPSSSCSTFISFQLGLPPLTATAAEAQVRTSVPWATRGVSPLFTSLLLSPIPSQFSPAARDVFMFGHRPLKTCERSGWPAGLGRSGWPPAPEPLSTLPGTTTLCFMHWLVSQALLSLHATVAAVLLSGKTPPTSCRSRLPCLSFSTLFRIWSPLWDRPQCLQTQLRGHFWAAAMLSALPNCGVNSLIPVAFFQLSFPYWLSLGSPLLPSAIPVLCSPTSLLPAIQAAMDMRLYKKSI